MAAAAARRRTCRCVSRCLARGQRCLVGRACPITRTPGLPPPPLARTPHCPLPRARRAVCAGAGGRVAAGAAAPQRRQAAVPVHHGLRDALGPGESGSSLRRGPCRHCKLGARTICFALPGHLPARTLLLPPADGGDQAAGEPALHRQAAGLPRADVRCLCRARAPRVSAVDDCASAAAGTAATRPSSFFFFFPLSPARSAAPCCAGCSWTRSTRC